MFSTRLHRARKAEGLSLRELAERVGVSHAAIKKYEDGLAVPSSTTLLALARALNVRSEYFFRPLPVSLGQVAYRKHRALPRKRLDSITHELIEQIERRIELEELFPQPPVKAFAAVRGLPRQITSLDEIEGVAERVREAWALGLNPIPDLTDTLEAHGIRVFMIDAEGDRQFDGLAAQASCHGQALPVVVVARQWPGDRQRFTLAHELGHLMLKGRLTSGMDEEAACNRFAGAFLFPRASVLQALGQRRNALEIQELALLKAAFGLSMAGILHRAEDLGIITPAYRAAQARLFRENGWHQKEPGTDYPREQAHVQEQLVFHALAEDYIGESKAAELLGMSLTDFHRHRLMGGITSPLASASDMIRPHVVDTALDDGYRAMAADAEREADAQEWCNALAGDMADASR